jgi:hypothetical protein
VEKDEKQNRGEYREVFAFFVDSLQHRHPPCVGQRVDEIKPDARKSSDEARRAAAKADNRFF